MAKEMISEFSAEIAADPAAAAQTGVTSNPIDMANCDGCFIIGGFGTKAADNTMKVQGSNVAGGGSGYGDFAVSNLLGDANTGFFIWSIHKPRYRYLQTVAARGTSTTTFPVLVLKYGVRLNNLIAAIANKLGFSRSVDAA